MNQIAQGQLWLSSSRDGGQCRGSNDMHFQTWVQYQYEIMEQDLNVVDNSNHAVLVGKDFSQ